MSFKTLTQAFTRTFRMDFIAHGEVIVFGWGLSTDLMIEQVLMRSVKMSGGLTRGKGLSETQRLVWLMSMPACAEVNNAMQTLTGVRYSPCL